MTYRSTRLFQNTGIDLGTTNTAVRVNGKGLQEPSVVAVYQETGKIIGAGRETKQDGTNL